MPPPRRSSTQPCPVRCRRPWRPPVSSRRSSRIGLVQSAAPVAFAAGAVVMIVLPLIGLLQRVSWSTLLSDLSAHDAFVALRLSLEVSLGALAIALVFGLPLAWILARHRFPGRALLRGLVTLPMVLPPVVGGIALLYAFGRRGLAGQVIYDLTGWRFVFNTSGAMLAAAFVSMPFLIVTAEASFRSMDRRGRRRPPPWGRTPPTASAGSTSPPSPPPLPPGPRSAGPAPWASSEPPSPSPATCRAPLRPRRCSSTWTSSPATRPPPWPCRWCCSWSLWACWSACGIGGWVIRELVCSSTASARGARPRGRPRRRRTGAGSHRRAQRSRQDHLPAGPRRLGPSRRRPGVSGRNSC